MRLVFIFGIALAVNAMANGQYTTYLQHNQGMFVLFIWLSVYAGYHDKIEADYWREFIKKMKETKDNAKD